MDSGKNGGEGWFDSTFVSWGAIEACIQETKLTNFFHKKKQC